MTAHHIEGDRYKAVLYLGRDGDKRQRQKSRSFRAPNQREADKLAEKHRTDMRNELGIEAAKVAATAGTFGEYFALWMDEIELSRSPTTMAGYRSCGKKLIAHFGAMPLEVIGAQDVRRWHAKLARGGMTPATIQHHHVLLRAVLRQAVKDDKIPKAATFGAPLPTLAPHEITLPKDADVLALVVGCGGELRIAVRIAAACGLRRGELVALRWSDIEGRFLKVSRALIEVKGVGVVEKSTKGKRSRTISLDYKTLRILAAHRRAQVAQAEQLGVTLDPHGDRRIVANMADDPTGQTAYTPGWLSHGWQTARGESGMRLHDLRHWYATKVLESRQATIAELSSWLGHAQVSTTLNIYTKADPARRRVSSKIMGPLLG